MRKDIPKAVTAGGSWLICSKLQISLFPFLPYLNSSFLLMSILALDLGGTKLAAALFSETGTILLKETIALGNRKGNDAGKLIVQQTENFLTKAGEINVNGIGICVPGIAYAKTGKVWAPNIPGWDDYPLGEELRSNFSQPIKIDSDRACYILGEQWQGNAMGCEDAIFLSVGTGIGAGILANDQVLRGSNDIAGAIGWMGLDRPFREEYEHCGCFEFNASGSGLAGLAGLTTRQVFEAYDKGDREAKRIIDNAIECWGMAVANLVSLFNPEKIIFGGGVFGPGLRFLDAIYAEAKKWAQPISIKQVQLEPSALGTDAGLYGAAYLLLKDEPNV